MTARIRRLLPLVAGARRPTLTQSQRALDVPQAPKGDLAAQFDGLVQCSRRVRNGLAP